MALTPEFRHIHCSSRFDRSAESLEHDLDIWMGDSSLITLTEVHHDHRTAKLREKGWAYYNAKKGGGADNCGICWRRDTWGLKWSGVRKLHTERYMRPQAHKPAGIVHAAAVVIAHKASGHRMLVTVAHLPSAVQQGHSFVHSGYDWRRRKEVYITSIKTWSTWVHHLQKRHRVDAVMVVADWNISLKDQWFQDFLHNHFGAKYRICWRHFPTAGSVLPSPGRIIDGTLARHLKIVEPADLMHAVRSSDHRPYKERLGFVSGAMGDDDPISGDTHPGKPWWGFGDYLSDDEIYELSKATGSEGGEVL